MADESESAIGDPFIVAGEYALGVLEGAELAAARRLLLADLEFANAVEWWEHRLGAMAEAIEQYSPSANVWRGIEARLGEQDGGTDVALMAARPRGPSGWSIATALAGLGAAAAALLLVLSVPATIEPLPADKAAVPSEQFVAQLQDAETGRRLASIIDPRNARLSLTITGLEADAGQTPELWVIPEGGAPVSLGAIPQTGSFARNLSTEEQALLVAGATLAVTFEEDSGQRHATPTMPILLAGALDRV